MGTYNKLKMKKFGPFKIVKRHDSRNAYEVELPADLNILLVFNISNLIEYYEGGDGDEFAEVQRSILVASSATKETEEILDSCVRKITRNRTNEKNLVKWKGRLERIHHG